MSNRANEIRKEIVEISEEYEEFLRSITNKGIGVTESLEIIKGFEDRAEELLEEYKMLVCPQCVKTRMDDILMQLGKVVFETEGNSNMDDVRYFIYDERPID